MNGKTWKLWDKSDYQITEIVQWVNGVLVRTEDVIVNDCGKSTVFAVRTCGLADAAHLDEADSCAGRPGPISICNPWIGSSRPLSKWHAVFYSLSLFFDKIAFEHKNFTNNRLTLKSENYQLIHMACRRIQYKFTMDSSASVKFGLSKSRIWSLSSYNKGCLSPRVIYICY